MYKDAVLILASIIMVVPKYSADVVCIIRVR